MALRPFFLYFGAKWRASKYYPGPKYDHIIEPFAGSACYSLRYGAGRKVTLIDADPIIVCVWRYLITAPESEILALPDIADGQSVDDLDVSIPARRLIGFWLGRGLSAPNKRMSKWGRDPRWRRYFWGQHVKERIARQLPAIRLWSVAHAQYTSANDDRATWFVDPPYRHAGKDYRYGSARIDYAALAEWCRSRRGQVIVCENEGEDWLPFQPVREVLYSREAAWVRG